MWHGSRAERAGCAGYGELAGDRACGRPALRGGRCARWRHVPQRRRQRGGGRRGDSRGGGEAVVVFLDLASRASIHEAARALLERWGRIDILVNNAVEWGTRAPHEAPLFEELPAEEWERILRANIAGSYTAIQAVVPSMRERRWGRIVNVSSGVAADGVAGAGPYAAAKAALHGLTRVLLRELGPAGILTNVVMPGLTLTEHMSEVVPAAMREAIAQASPIRRLLTPEEVVPTIVFLCSAANTAVTGEILRASGGST